ncbi:eukaryotic translation initiation factor 3 subunit G [Topomyia yanbarensis]|uniref:eukaryotic translation initiation factor 3 subunit G n=1 Tax=Topomyia yanbarensis TaxID=2498891 RepID=UPI00273CA2BE|nr:eukaryotic translation initiation factor 3 subunit G [Topomyia yanbarensis]XP_058832291.1 eukaryotic translation initiation factor 3 subunit G [Topomyia yanbarensis]
MPALDEIKSSWADEVELDSGSLPAPTEVIENNQKVVTEYKYNKDDKVVKVVRTYKITRLVVPKSVAKRKAWQKFGDSTHDKAGPNPGTTMVSEDIYMQFVSNKEEEQKPDNALDTLKVAKCRICEGEHWSVQCPYKGTTYETTKTKPQPSVQPETTTQHSVKSGKYVPPSMRDSQKVGMGANPRGRDDTTAIRISNLSEAMTEADLEELVKKIGPHSKMFLARDKNTGLCKGFAYVHFKSRRDAATAIELLNGHGYDHLILNVEWSKPQNPQ